MHGKFLFFVLLSIGDRFDTYFLERELLVQWEPLFRLLPIGLPSLICVLVSPSVPDNPSAKWLARYCQTERQGATQSSSKLKTHAVFERRSLQTYRTEI